MSTAQQGRQRCLPPHTLSGNNLAPPGSLLSERCGDHLDNGSKDGSSAFPQDAFLLSNSGPTHGSFLRTEPGNTARA